MSELLIFVVVGLVLVLLLLWVQRSAEITARKKELPETRETLSTLQLQLPSRALVDRIFALADWDFVSSQAPARLQRAFLQERRAVALLWVRQTRMKVGRLMDFHLRAVRRNVALSPAVEIMLAIHYILFLLISELLLGLIWLRGPFCARKMVGYAASVGEDLAFTFGSLLARLDPVHLGRMKADWLRRSAAS